MFLQCRYTNIYFYFNIEKFILFLELSVYFIFFNYIKIYKMFTYLFYYFLESFILAGSSCLQNTNMLLSNFNFFVITTQHLLLKKQNKFLIIKYSLTALITNSILFNEHKFLGFSEVIMRNRRFLIPQTKLQHQNTISTFLLFNSYKYLYGFIFKSYYLAYKYNLYNKQLSIIIYKNKTSNFLKLKYMTLLFSKQARWYNKYSRVLFSSINLSTLNKDKQTKLTFFKYFINKYITKNFKHLNLCNYLQCYTKKATFSMTHKFFNNFTLLCKAKHAISYLYYYSSYIKYNSSVKFSKHISRKQLRIFYKKTYFATKQYLFFGFNFLNSFAAFKYNFTTAGNISHSSLDLLLDFDITSIFIDKFISNKFISSKVSNNNLIKLQVQYVTNYVIYFNMFNLSGTQFVSNLYYNFKKLQQLSVYKDTAEVYIQNLNLFLINFFSVAAVAHTYWYSTFMIKNSNSNKFTNNYGIHEISIVVMNAILYINWHNYLYSQLLNNICIESTSLLTNIINKSFPHDFIADTTNLFYEKLTAAVLPNNKNIQDDKELFNNIIDSFAKIYGEELTLSAVRTILPRIQFKPGYPTFFRQLRTNFKKIQQLSFIRQHQLTTYLYKIRRLFGNQRLFFSELSLITCVIRSHFITNRIVAEKAIVFGFFYINGLVCTVPHFQIQRSDFVQMLVSYESYNFIIIQFNQYIYYSFMLAKNLFLKKYRTTVKYLNTAITRRGTMIGKTIKHKPIDYLNNINIAFLDIPDYYEVCYFTLSIILLYDSISLVDVDKTAIVLSGTSYIRMLNWKYIV